MVLLVLGVQHLLAVVGSVVVQARILASAGVCEPGTPCDEAVANGLAAPPGVVCECYIASGSSLPDHIVTWTVLISGLCTALQSSPLGPFSSNLLSIMGTSSAFIGVVGITGRKAMPGHGIPLVMGMNAITFWVEPFLMYVLPEGLIHKLLDPTVKGTVVIVIGLTLTARVGVKLWVGDGGGVDLIVGFVCVALMARASKTKRSIKIRGVKIYIKSISLLISIVVGQILFWLMHSSDALLMALDDESNSTLCKQPSTGFGKPGYGYDFSQVVESSSRLSPTDFHVAGLRCSPGRLDPWTREPLEFSGPVGDCSCPAGKDPPCACACKNPGEDFIVAGCEIPGTVTYFDFGPEMRLDPWAPGQDGHPCWYSLLVPWLITRIAATLESVGDVTATAKYSGKRVDGKHFAQRLRGALNMDALSGLIASLCGSFPLTTMSQNNGLIKMSGMHDWRGGLVAGGMMMIIAPAAAKFNPDRPVIGGCLTVIYASIAMGGISMLTEVSEADKKAFKSSRKQSLVLPVDKPRTVFIVAASVGLGLGAEMHAYGLNGGHTLGYGFLGDAEKWYLQALAIIFESGIATATLMALALSFVWPDSDAALTKREFLKFDKNGSGKIDAAELKIAIRSLGLHISDSELAAMMAAADKDGDGELDYAEFEAMIKNTAEGAADWALVRQHLGAEDPADVTSALKYVHEAFRNFDEDGSGSIDASELKLALQHMGLKLSAAEISALLTSADKDGNGEIDMDEFEGMMLATAEGAAVWDNIRKQATTANAGRETCSGELARSAVIQCVEINKWLVAHGLGDDADAVLQSFIQAGYTVAEWLPKLKSMTPTELETLAAASREGSSIPPSEPNRPPPPTPVSPALQPSDAGVGVMLEEVI
eukprot:SAG31_NODE_41_length_31342_cov_8.029286_30_plen_879_part_00